jgi:hypothetical protein
MSRRLPDPVSLSCRPCKYRLQKGLRFSSALEKRAGGRSTFRLFGLWGGRPPSQRNIQPKPKIQGAGLAPARPSRTRHVVETAGRSSSHRVGRLCSSCRRGGACPRPPLSDTPRRRDRLGNPFRHRIRRSCRCCPYEKLVRLTRHDMTGRGGRPQGPPLRREGRDRG